MRPVKRIRVHLTSTRKGQWLTRRIERRWGSPDHIWMWKLRRCWHCNRWTAWAELNYQTALHPGHCTREKDAQYDADSRDSRRLKLHYDLHRMLKAYVPADVKLPADPFERNRTVDNLLEESARALRFYGYDVQGYH